MYRSEYSLAANVTVALWLSVQWTCCFGEKAGGWYPTYLITDDVHHTSSTDFAARQPSEKERMLGICKQGLTDVAADDLWGSAEDLCHMHATELKVFRVKDKHKTRHCRSNQHSPNEQLHVQLYSTFLTTDSILCIYLCIVRENVQDNTDKTCRMCNADGHSPILYINLYMNQHFPKKKNHKDKAHY